MQTDTAKSFFIIQWIGGDRYYVKKTYCGRVILSSHKIDAKLWTWEAAKKYLKKLQTISVNVEFSIRQLQN